ncbi:MAG: xylulokinase [Thiolinea sp.]
MYLGIDIGTSGVKSLLMDEHQQILASAHASLQVSRPQAGWSEQNPADWITATEATLTGLKQQHPVALAAVRGIGLSGQMHGATVLDKTDQVLRPCILWNDTRSHAEAAELDSNPVFRQVSGNIVFPGFTAPKLVWMRHHEPELFARAERVLLPKDYVRLWLTGEVVSECSDAAGTAWLDVAQRCWSDKLLEASGMHSGQMPRLVEGCEVSGQLRAELCQRWGMKHAPVVAGGGGDNAASACGMGVIEEGQAFVSLGTSGVLFAANQTYRPLPESAVHAFCHALPDTWHQMGVILSAASALSWYAGICEKPVKALTTELGNVLHEPESATFLPYLSGERTPHNDAMVRGAFLGLDHRHNRQAMTRAVLSGVTFALRDNLEALNAAGSAPKRLTAIGGGANSDYWLRLMATVLGLPVDVPAAGDFGAAFGAARLGLLAESGLEPTVICTPPEIETTFAPVTELAAAYEEAYQVYRHAYSAIRAC